MLQGSFLPNHCSLQVTKYEPDYLSGGGKCTPALKIDLFFFSSRSDGTSRTGTYILIDMVLNRMAKGEGSHADSAVILLIRLFKLCIFYHLHLQ